MYLGVVSNELSKQLAQQDQEQGFRIWIKNTVKK